MKFINPPNFTGNPGPGHCDKTTAIGQGAQKSLPQRLHTGKLTYLSSCQEVPEWIQ